MPPQPCHGCVHAGNCSMAGLVNRLAVEKWLADHGFECADYSADNYHGIEGVRA
jgi:hypothetical protein